MVGLGVSWLLILPLYMSALVVPIVLFGLPATLWRAWSNWRNPGRKQSSPLRVLAAWALATVPAALIVLPWF